MHACGRVHTANLLWDRYLDMEKHYKHPDLVCALFLRLLQLPIAKLYEYFTRFKAFIESPARKLPELGQPELDIHAPDYPAELELAKKRVLDKALALYEHTVIEANKRKSFESGIKRSFFHAKPLDDEQLQNWRLYLEFEEQEGDPTLITLLYERCVVPACLYAEFWCRYAQYMERVQGIDAARALYQKANSKFLFRRPDLFLSQGYFEEVIGNLDEARRLYMHVYQTIQPGLLSALLKHLNLERRQGRLDQVQKLYAEALLVARGNTQALAHLAVHYARFQHQLLLDLPAAIHTLETHLHTDNKQLYLAYVQYLRLMPANPTRNESIRAAYERALVSQMAKDHKMELWLSYVEFMRTHWEDHEQLMQVESRFQASFFLGQAMTKVFKDKLKIKRHVSATAEQYPEVIKMRKL